MVRFFKSTPIPVTGDVWTTVATTTSELIWSIYLSISKVPVSLQCGTIINFLEAIFDHLEVADLEAGCSRLLPTTDPLPLDKIAVLMSLKRSSVPLSPTIIEPFLALKKSKVFNLDLFIISIIAEDARLSLP